MTSYEMVIAILGGGLLLAAVIWAIPLLRRRRQIRRFRNALNHVDVVATAWSQSLRPGWHRQDGEAPTEESSHDD